MFRSPLNGVGFAINLYLELIVSDFRKIYSTHDGIMKHAMHVTADDDEI